ncbi:MAG: hypothetical protein AAF649_00600 [Verrucomicrobiota bacterium]
MRGDSLETVLGITLRELCLAAILLTVMLLISYPVARYYWLKASQNAQVIRHWDEGGLAKNPLN